MSALVPNPIWDGQSSITYSRRERCRWRFFKRSKLSRSIYCDRRRSKGWCCTSPRRKGNRCNTSRPRLGRKKLKPLSKLEKSRHLCFGTENEYRLLNIYLGGKKANTERFCKTSKTQNRNHVDQFRVWLLRDNNTSSAPYGNCQSRLDGTFSTFHHSSCPESSDYHLFAFLKILMDGKSFNNDNGIIESMSSDAFVNIGHWCDESLPV